MPDGRSPEESIHSETFLHTLETNPLLFVLYWLIKLGRVVYLIAVGTAPFFRFLLKNARSQAE